MTAPKVNFFETKKVEERKTQEVQNTQESREAKETQKLKSTDVYSYAAESNVNTYGNFQNYDGFVRQTKEKQEEEKGKSLLNSVKSGTADAKAKKTNCEDYSDQASTDVNNVNKNVKKQQQATKTMQNNVTKTVAERKQVDQETESLKSEADSLNTEIASLMAEDGQDYTPQTVADAPQPQAQDNNMPAVENEAISSASTGDGAGTTATNATADQTGGISNPFAMNSLSYSDAAQTAVPTSETAVSAQNSQAAKDQGIIPQQNGTKQAQQQKGTAKNASPVAGNSLKSFSSSLVQPQGKNADKINQLMSQLTSTNSKITSNQTKSASLTNQATKTTNTFQQQLNNIMSQTVTTKTKSQENYKGAQIAQTTGQITSAMGGVASATGAAMLATSFGTNQLGTALVIGGGAGTAAGTATTTIAQVTQKDTQGAINTANSGVNSLKSDASTLLNVKQMIKTA